MILEEKNLFFRTSKNPKEYKIALLVENLRQCKVMDYKWVGLPPTWLSISYLKKNIVIIYQKYFKGM